MSTKSSKRWNWKQASDGVSQQTAEEKPTSKGTQPKEKLSGFNHTFQR